MKRLCKHEHFCMEVHRHAYHDQIAGGSGKNRLANCQSQPAHLFFQILSSRFHAASAICNTGFTPVPQDRLSRHNPDTQGLLRTSQGPWPQENTPLFHPLLCRKTAFKKRAFESFLNTIFEQASDIGLLDEHPQAAVDATGLESRHTSRYYVRRRGYKRFLRYHWPKVTAVCDTKTHLFVACIVTRGPSKTGSNLHLQLFRQVNSSSLINSWQTQPMMANITINFVVKNLA